MDTQKFELHLMLTFSWINERISISKILHRLAITPVITPEDLVVAG
jgi:hypothetical protein